MNTPTVEVFPNSIEFVKNTLFHAFDLNKQSDWPECYVNCLITFSLSMFLLFLREKSRANRLKNNSILKSL